MLPRSNFSALRLLVSGSISSGVSSHMDDEYKWAGVEDPKIMVTTSRDPSSRLKMFAKVGSVCPQLCSGSPEDEYREEKLSHTSGSF